MRLYTDLEVEELVECSMNHDLETAVLVCHCAEGRREIEELVAERRLPAW